MEADHAVTAVFEVVRGSGQAEAADVIGAGEGAALQRGQPAPDQRTVHGQLACSQHAVEAFPDHVHGLVHLADVQPDLRAGLEEALQTGQQEVARLGAVHVDPDEA